MDTDCGQHLRMRSTCASRFLAVLGLAVFMFAETALSSNGAQQKRILVVHSFEQTTSPFSAFNASFREHMLRAWPAKAAFYDVSLEGWRPGLKANEDALVQMIRTRFSDLRMDLVVAVGARAAQFYVRYREELFPNVPLLLFGDERASPLSLLAPDDSFVGAKSPGVQLVNGILNLLPGTTTIAVIFGNSPLEQFWVNEYKKEFATVEGRVKFLWLNHLSLTEMRERVAELSPGTVVLFGFMLVDAADIPYQEHYALSELRTASSVPIFGFFESELGLGVVGGTLWPNVKAAAVTAKVASRMLRGEQANDDAVTYVSATAPRFDWRELKRWHIDEARLPPGSEVMFRPPTMWEEHRGVILAGSGVLAIQTALIIALLAQHNRRRQAEGESITLSGRLLTVHEDERRRLARELHDDVTQRLARLAIDAARVEGVLAAALPAQRSSVHDDLVRLSDDVHALSYRLHPSILDDLGLEEALKAECEHVSGQADVRIEIDVQPLPDKLPQDISLCVFRVAQEALRNVVRHAHASVAAVTLAPTDRGLMLTVKDNGRGFDTGAVRARPSLGHAGMEERIRLIGGRLSITSKSGLGTTVSAWVPLSAASSMGPS